MIDITKYGNEDLRMKKTIETQKGVRIFYYSIRSKKYIFRRWKIKENKFNYDSGWLWENMNIKKLPIKEIENIFTEKGFIHDNPRI